MTDFGCDTVWLNKYGRNDGKPPTVTLVGEQLLKREAEYCHAETSVIDLEEGTRLGASSTREIGKSKMKHLGFDTLNTLGISQNAHNKIQRKTIILGEVEEKLFGQKNFEQIGITNNNPPPPTAMLVRPSKHNVKPPKNYWEQTLVSDLYKKITKELKKYFKDPKE